MIHTEIISKTGRLLRTWRVTACTRLRSPNQEKTVKESSKNREKKKLTTKADLTALVTLRQCKTISSSVTALVSFIPSATIARLSPTRTISIPALSATYAEGKSWAVSIAMGSFFLYMLRRVDIVVGLRICWDEAGPMGACELHRVCKAVVVVMVGGTSAADKDADMTGLQGVRTVAESTPLDRELEPRSEDPSLRAAGEGVMLSCVVKSLFVQTIRR